MQTLTNAGIMALASMFVGVLPLSMGVVYAIWPTDHRLILMRTLSLATIFASITGTSLGLMNELVFMARTQTLSLTGQVAAGLAESLMTVFFGFGCLTVAWLCVAVGTWRRP